MISFFAVARRPWLACRFINALKTYVKYNIHVQNWRCVVLTDGEFVILDRYLKSTNEFRKSLDAQNAQLSSVSAQKDVLTDYVDDLENVIVALRKQNGLLSLKLENAESDLRDSEIIIQALQC